MTDIQKTLAEQISERANEIAQMAGSITHENPALADAATNAHDAPFLITGLTVFVLACFVGYHVVWRVTPALHSPLMGVTNAISSVIIVGALMAASPFVAEGLSTDSQTSGFTQILGFLAIVLASVNIFGGFIITRRMLSMFRKKGE